MTRCANAGRSHIKRMRGMGHRIKLGVQTCRFCGAIIEVTSQDGWAFTPPHEKPDAKADTKLD